MGKSMKRDMNVPAGQSRKSRWERDTGHPPKGDVPCPATPMPAVLVELADRVRRLVPSHRDPEAFHEAKSEIEAELRLLSRVLPPVPVCGRRERLSSLDEPRLSPKVSGLRKG